MFCSTITAFSLYQSVRKLSYSKSHFFTKTSSRAQVLKNRQELPTFKDLAINILVGEQKNKSIENIQNENGSLLSVSVEDFSFSPNEYNEFCQLCGDGMATISHIFPHVLGQTSLLALISHPQAKNVIPFSLIGAVHLRSYFETLDSTRLSDFINQRSNHVIGETTYSMNAELWGVVPSSNGKGTEIVLTLSLWGFAKNNLEEIWRETLIWYSSNKLPVNFTAPDSQAQKIISKLSQLCPDFSNISETVGDHMKDVSVCSGAETWRFGCLSGDVNPIHMSTPLAWMLGQKGRIAHGAMVIGKVLSVLEKTQKLNAASGILTQFGVSLKGPVPCGSTISLRLDPSLKKIDIFSGNSSRPSICLRSF